MWSQWAGWWRGWWQARAAAGPARSWGGLGVHTAGAAAALLWRERCSSPIGNLQGLKFLLISIVFNEDLLQLMVDAFHAAGHPRDRGLWHSDVGQWHLGRLRHGKLLQRAHKHTHTHTRTFLRHTHYSSFTIATSQLRNVSFPLVPTWLDLIQF